MTTQDLINELKCDDQNREVEIVFKPHRAVEENTELEVEYIMMVPHPIITLIEK